MAAADGAWRAWRFLSGLLTSQDEEIVAALCQCRNTILSEARTLEVVDAGTSCGRPLCPKLASFPSKFGNSIAIFCQPGAIIHVHTSQLQPFQARVRRTMPSAQIGINRTTAPSPKLEKDGADP